ncbi:MAG: hypothetical protein K2X93_16075 [Candidatus Obscuribacterales bacterium]|nr:hypothetical protein [Candidatus Obscuribacterales bacterium]
MTIRYSDLTILETVNEEEMSIVVGGRHGADDLPGHDNGDDRGRRRGRGGRKGGGADDGANHT